MRFKKFKMFLRLEVFYLCTPWMKVNSILDTCMMLVIERDLIPFTFRGKEGLGQPPQSPKGEVSIV
jgi:hypothetical protein